MCKSGRMLVLTLGTLLSTTVFADEPEPPRSERQPLVEPTLTVEELLTSPDYAFAWALPDSTHAVAYADDRTQPLADFSFEDSSALARVRKLRYLSLFTFMETRKTRLFLGVNDDGFLGLHFNAVSDASDGQFLELARMPYLGESSSDGEQDGSN